MTINVDLFLLETWQRFQDFCFQLARAEFGYAFPMGLTWDGGRDVVVVMSTDGKRTAFAALQCKFSKSCGSDTKRSILKSLDALDTLPVRPAKWILCMPIDPSGRFFDWFQEEMSRRALKNEVWGRAELLARLEKRPDIFQTFFYRVFAELREAFVTDELELRRVRLDSRSDWSQRDPKVLAFGSRGTQSPDLVLDVIVRNRGTLDAVLMKLVAEVRHYLPMPHGIPGPGLLFPRITYAVSVGHGQPGRYESECEPPLVIRAAANERFMLRLTETGYSWTGFVQISLDYGGKFLPLPSIRLST